MGLRLRVKHGNGSRHGGREAFAAGLAGSVFLA